jgi:hypothetical protein
VVFIHQRLGNIRIPFSHARIMGISHNLDPHEIKLTEKKTQVGRKQIMPSHLLRQGVLFGMTGATFCRFADFDQ